ncbi:MFS transporter [Mucilaginibacter limnophilus]|uniref:MFS transporter n=1 Tax=Mucilaginibacter limnophilus TaxID=1932778 RepID=A0A3S2V371_9SPHI|nr:MFS transporter [Mucilaginibacter limnophilus]
MKQDPYAALRYKDFRSYISMRFFFTFAYQMQTIVLGAYIYDITHDKIALALIGLFEAIPAIGLALFGGYFSDKFEKRKLLLTVFAAVIFSSSVMLVVTYHGMAQHLHITHIVPVIYAMIFVNGAARAFYAPAAFTVMANSVPKEVYPNSSTWNGSTWKIASIVAPVVGGFVYGIYGITPVFIIILSFLLITLFAVSMLKKIEPVFVPKEGVFKSLSEGIRFVFSNRMMLGAISLDMFSVFFGGVVMLLPVFAKDILHVGPEGLGLMRGASSLGAVVTMLAMTRYSPMAKPWRNLLFVVTGFGLSIICFALSRNFYLSLFFLFAEGAFDSVSMTIRGTIMQLLTPDNMRGRVSSVNQMFISSSNEIGDFESGVAAHFLGTVPAAIFGGCMTLVVVTITFLKTKKLVPLSLHEINAEPEVAK